MLAIAVVVLVLLQQGKGADAGAAFGSGSSASVFGAGGSGSFLQRTTTLIATAFFVTSLSLAVMAAHRSDDAGSSVVDRAPAPIGEELPAEADLPGLDDPAPATDDEGDLPPLE